MFLDIFTGVPDFVARHHCGDWSTFYIKLYILSNAVISFAYLFVALQVLFFILVRIKYKELCEKIIKEISSFTLCCFLATFLLCGLGHVLENCMAFVWPAYRFFAIFHFLTALVAFPTCLILPIQFIKGLKNYYGR